VVYAGTQDGHLYAFRASDGFTIWRVLLHPIDNLFLMNVTGGVVFVVAAFGGNVDALGQSSGSVIWQYPGKAGGSVPITVVQGVVYLAQYATGANILANITALRASDGILLWSYKPHTSYRQLLPLVGNDIVLIALQDGSVEALRASSGSLLWRRAMNS
jgi:outer membrane protein assembly factor BamB